MKCSRLNNYIFHRKLLRWSVHVSKYCIFQEKLLTKEKENIEKTIKECEEKARKEAERVAKLHQKEIDRLNDR